MGFNSIYFNEIKKLNLDFSNLDLLELGDQEIHDSSIGILNSKLRNAKIFNTKSYIVYDLHEREGVEIYDLSIIHEEYKKFDVITNFGTTEHVEPQQGQYNCWLNVHNLLKINGIIINIVPCSNGGWEDHCRYYYNDLFFKQFEQIGYSILEYKIIADRNCFCVLKKINNSKFLSEKEFWKNIIFKEENNSNIIYFDNNPKNLKF